MDNQLKLQETKGVPPSPLEVFMLGAYNSSVEALQVEKNACMQRIELENEKLEHINYCLMKQSPEFIAKKRAFDTLLL